MVRNAALILALILAPLAARAELRPYRMVHDGIPRSYHLYVPDRLARFPGPRPLVLVLHGGGGSAREVRYSTRGRFDDLAEAHGFLVLYPDALGRIWDTGSGEISARLDPRRDDAGFLKAAIAAIETDHRIDRDRVFATGVSRGGMESYALACGTLGLIRAIAPVAMTPPEASAAACATGAPLGFLLIHGTADPFVPHAGGPINLGRRDDGGLQPPQPLRGGSRRDRRKGPASGRHRLRGTDRILQRRRRLARLARRAQGHSGRARWAGEHRHFRPRRDMGLLQPLLTGACFEICTARIPAATMATPIASASPICSFSRAAATRTPKNGLRKW